MREYEVAVGFVWGEWKSFYVDARSEAEAHQKILEKEAFYEGAVTFVRTINVNEIELAESI